MRRDEWNGYFSDATYPIVEECERLLKQVGLRILPARTETRAYAVLEAADVEHPEGRKVRLRFEERLLKGNGSHLKISLLPFDRRELWKSELEQAQFQLYHRTTPQWKDRVTFRVFRVEQVRTNANLLRDLFGSCVK
ncbi:MAG TPA: hypothetical protein VMT20_04415 [Terriglobia bacterium]|nr:hypothetical protein [Terriglobia bacterium]